MRFAPFSLYFDYNISYWYFFATLYLIILTYQDYKNKRMVDDRKNWVMTGITISLISHIESTLTYKIGLTIFILFVVSVLNKVKVFGEADNNSLTWILMGLAMINPLILMSFLALFAVFSLIYLGVKKHIFKESRPVAFYGVILLCFIINNLITRNWGILSFY